MVMLDEEVFENQHQLCLRLEAQNSNASNDEVCDPAAYGLNYESELFESERSQSYDDFAADLDYICHRRRSNTAQRLDRIREDKLKQSKTRTIVWRNTIARENLSEETSSDDSRKSGEDESHASSKSNQSSNKTKAKSLPVKSGITRLLEKYPHFFKNPFDEFAKFDGGMCDTTPVKRITIFVAVTKPQQGSSVHEDSTTVDNSDRSNQLSNSKFRPGANKPLDITIVSTASVRDLIGLICWQYTNEGREPRLDDDIDRYCLRIAEDNGEVDPDFVSLNPKEPLSTFNFPSLALTEKSDETRAYNNAYSDTSHIYNRPIARNIITTSAKFPSSSGRLAALTRIIFRDAKLENTG